MKGGRFDTEGDLCDAFVAALPEGWTAYCETAGYDIVLVHKGSGFQIAVEAKLKLNAHVLNQVTDAWYSYRADWGPDCRAVLVDGAVAHIAPLARKLGVTVVSLSKAEKWMHDYNGTPWIISPALPEAVVVEELPQQVWLDRQVWFDEAPTQRCALPEYVPDVPAGRPAPMVLSTWKIQAIKLCVWLEEHHYITRKHFKAFKIDPSRWMNEVWLKPTGARGVWEAAPHFPGPQFKREHPTIWELVIADQHKWSLEIPEPPVIQTQGELL